MGAPLVLPYVNVAGRVPAAGGQIVQFADTAQSVLYGTAHAANYTIPPDSPVNVMNADDTMNVNNSGTGTVTTMSGGVQNVHSGGTGMVVTMSGGTQIVNNGGTGTVTTMNGGEQIVGSGGTGTVSSLQSGGTQIVNYGGMAISTTIDNGGTQSVLSGGTATDTTLKYKGKQIVSSGGVASGGTFSGVNTNTRGYQEVFEGGTVVGAIFSAYGNQTVTGGMARDTTVTSGGIQAITNKGVSLNAAIMSGGTQSATEGGILAGTQTIEAGASASGGTLKEITVEGKTFKGVQNVNSGGTANNITVTGGGTQFVLSGGRANGVTLDGGTLSMAGGAIASGTVGGHGKVVYDGGSGQIPLGGTNNFSSFTVSGGTLETQNGFQINSSGGITVNSGGTLIAGGAVTVQTSGSSLTVSGGGTFSATNISAENGGEVSMSGGVLQAAGDITIRHALTNAYGDVCAGGTLTVGAGATHPTDKELNLSAGKNINADGQVVSATNISAGGAIAAGSITAANVIADGSISASANISADAISAVDTVSAGGNLTAGTLALSAVPASGAAVSAVGDVNVTDLNVSDFNPAQNTNGSLISAGGTVSAKTVNGKSLTAGSTVDTNVKQAQPKAGIDATFDSLSVSLAADQKTLTYDAHNTYKDIAFSTVPWNTGSAYYEAAASDRFNDNTSISAEKLSFTFAEESQKASLASGSTMTLFANATGLPAGMAVNYSAGKTSVAQEVSYSAPNGVALRATLTGTVATVAGAAVTSETTTSEETTGAINYTASSMTLDSVELAGWDGVASSAVPSGWTAKSGTAVTVYTDNINNLPEMEAGTSRDILTASVGYFSLDKIEGTNKFGNGDAFNEKLNGVAVTGHKLGGIKDTNNGAALTYFAMKKNVENITLGEMTFTDGGTAATLTGVYDATGATINADSLKFSKASCPAMEPGNTMTIVDATGAIKNAKGESLKALTAGTKTSFTNDFTDTVANKGITFTGTHTDTLSQDAAKAKLTYTVGAKNVSTAALAGEIVWNNGDVHYENTKYNFSVDSVTSLKGLTFAARNTDPWGQSMTLIGGNAAGTVTGAPESFGVSVDKTNTTLAATASGSASVEDGSVKYAVTGVILDKVTVKGAGGTADKVPEQWTLAKDGNGNVTATIETDGMTVPTVDPGKHIDILQSDTDNFFSGVKINGINAYKTEEFTEQDTAQSVTVAGAQGKGVTLNSEKKHIIYAVSKKDVNTVTLGRVDFVKDTTLLDRSGTEYNYATVTTFGTDGFNITYAAPETVTAGDSMTLLKANETLQDMAAVEKQKQYKVTMQSGDLAMYTVDAILTGNLTANSGRVAFTATVNQATKLSFENVNWLDSGALIDHKTTLANVSFNGAVVDTSKINFINKQGLEANQQMTLVSDFGGKPGKITGTTYKVGTAFEGEGAAEMSGDDLIFKTKTGAGHVSDETHHAVMAAEAGMALLAAGSEHVGNVMSGIGLKDNAGSDGTSVAASLGGGAFHYETGSHVNSHTWNAVVAAGAKKELEKGTLQYGLFGEYGKGNYTLHSNAGRGDGDAHYAGGGLLARWTNKYSVYAEASIRQGRMSDTASDILHDAAGNGYGYNVHTNYFGVHLGLGKVFWYNSGHSLDVYGKYFYTKRNGVSFEAGTDHYDLDSVASSILRIGARYGSTDKKWNWYGGLAYEYEFDGEANGTVNDTAIRAANVKGGSVRGEIGLRIDATTDNPWKADIAVYGYGGKHRGFGGNVTVAYTF